MADMQTYGYNDIQRYLQHKMTQQEMHDFEKALMNDPFLADALEGYSSGNAALAGKHLSGIESELNSRKEKVKVVAMPVQKTGWWKVAAVVLVVATGGALTYSLLTANTDEKNVARQMSPAKATEMASKTDSIGLGEKPLAQVEVLPKKELLKSKKNTSSVISQPKISPVATIQSEELKADTAISSIMEKNEKTSAIMDRNAAVAAALKISANPDTLEQGIEVRKSVLSPAFAEDQFKGKVADTNNKILQSEVVVPQFNQKKAKSDVKHLREKTENGAEPIGGWKNFERYLSGQIDSLKASNIDGEDVELEFSIDEQGRPANIKVPPEPDSLIAAKAVQILINGPQWKIRRKDKKVKVIIAF